MGPLSPMRRIRLCPGASTGPPGALGRSTDPGPPVLYDEVTYTSLWLSSVT
jgi:hypothetical protein